MARPKKCRYIGRTPNAYYFKPRAVPLRYLKEVSLTLDELEAMRLADYEGLYHEKAAGKMKVSRATFGRILDQARKKVVEAILEGKALKIEADIGPAVCSLSCKEDRCVIKEAGRKVERSCSKKRDGKA
jgi:uncharacterized protein